MPRTLLYHQVGQSTGTFLLCPAHSHTCCAHTCQLEDLRTSLFLFHRCLCTASSATVKLLAPPQYTVQA